MNEFNRKTFSFVAHLTCQHVKRKPYNFKQKSIYINPRKLTTPQEQLIKIAHATQIHKKKTMILTNANNNSENKKVSLF